MSEAERLLLEWFTWWQHEDAAPTAKPPRALHIRTVTYLLKNHADDPEVERVLPR